MLSIFREFSSLLGNNLIKIENDNLDRIFQTFEYHFFSKENQDLDFISKIKEATSISQITFISEYDKANHKNNFGINMFIICFNRQLLFIEESEIQQLQQFFIKNCESKVTFLTKSIQTKLEQVLNLQFKIAPSKEKNEQLFKAEIQSFTQQFRLIKKVKKKMNEIENFFILISESICGYLIQNSYNKLKEYDRVSHFKDYQTEQTELKMNQEDYIVLRKLGPATQNSNVNLIYHIEREELYAMKIYPSEDSDELFERERFNYLKIQHPLFLRYLGTAQYYSYKTIVVEYIDCESIECISEMKLSKENKIKMVFQIMIAIEYLHLHGFIYRDLKPDNIFFINNEGSICIIDFDRMILDSKIYEFTQDFQHDFVAPEAVTGKPFSNKADIYSLGKIIEFVFFDEFQVKDSTEYSNLKEICDKCILVDDQKRPNISELIDLFYINYYSTISAINESDTIKNIKDIHSDKFINFWFFLSEKDNLVSQRNLGYLHEHEFKTQDKAKIIQYYTESANQNDFVSQYTLGYFYLKGEYVQPDINKSFHYLTLASNQNYSYAQCQLGEIYYQGKYVQKDIKKALHYLTLASNQNHSYAQYKLGEIYFYGKYVQKDISKAIHYFTLSSNEGDLQSQYILGIFYYSGEYIQHDINKSLHYLTLSANQNFAYAQYDLGRIYYEGKYIKKDINKSIYYLKLAADQGNSKAQQLLGEIYCIEESIPTDMDKSIHYLQLASDQNNSDAQYMLGRIYYDGKYIEKDINKAMHYFTLSANNNKTAAQYYLGFIYYLGEYVKKDISKSIYYLTLASKAHSDAQYLLGGIYYEGKYVERDMNKSIYYLTLASNNNHIEAQNLLGIIYIKGKYVERDINKSIYYLTLASNNNHSYAQSTLGKIFYVGEYVQKNINKALHYLSLALKQNDSKAQYWMGIIYYDGFDVPRDIDKSIYYLTLASNQNCSDAQFKLGIIYLEEKYVQQDINKSIYYLTLASNQNCSDAQFQLGIIYYEGIHVQQDVNKAIQYFTSAAIGNVSLAQYYLGLIYYENKYVKRDINKAIYYLNKSAVNDDSDAMYLLGVIYLDGEVVKQNVSKGIHYLTLSADQNNPSALFFLGVIYYRGFNVERNMEKSIHYFKESSNLNDHRAKNYLGVIYKNGDGVKKNINYTIEYFNEAIRHGNDAFSMYNLARVYYFGIDIEKDESKAIELLLKASENGILLADLFLFFIFTFGDKKLRDKKKASFYENKFFKFSEIEYPIRFLKIKMSIDFHVISEQLEEFFKNYDLVSFLDKGRICLIKYKKEIQVKSIVRPIDKHFYDGFYK